jgi:hypothetical protein
MGPFFATEDPMHARTLAAITLALAMPVLAADGTAKGTVVYKGNTAAIKHVWMVKGPDVVDPRKTVRLLVFSATDIGAKVKACQKMTCVDSGLDDGVTAFLDAGERINYWVALKGQRIQYSGTAKLETLKATANTPQRVAGKLAIDDSKAGGARIDIDFDVPLLAELKVAR